MSCQFELNYCLCFQSLRLFPLKLKYHTDSTLFYNRKLCAQFHKDKLWFLKNEHSCIQWKRYFCTVLWPAWECVYRVPLFHRSFLRLGSPTQASLVHRRVLFRNNCTVWGRLECWLQMHSSWNVGSAGRCAVWGLLVGHGQSWTDV